MPMRTVKSEHVAEHASDATTTPLSARLNAIRDIPPNRWEQHMRWARQAAELARRIEQEEAARHIDRRHKNPRA